MKAGSQKGEATDWERGEVWKHRLCEGVCGFRSASRPSRTGGGERKTSAPPPSISSGHGAGRYEWRGAKCGEECFVGCVILLCTSAASRACAEFFSALAIWT